MFLMPTNLSLHLVVLIDLGKNKVEFFVRHLVVFPAVEMRSAIEFSFGSAGTRI